MQCERAGTRQAFPCAEGYLIPIPAPSPGQATGGQGTLNGKARLRREIRRNCPDCGQRIPSAPQAILTSLADDGVDARGELATFLRQLKDMA